MAVHIAIPRIGMTMTEAIISEWRFKEGEWVEEGQAVLDMETEKISSEVPATAAGFLHIMVDKGKKVTVSRVVGLLAKSQEELQTLQKEPPKEMYATAVVAAEVAPAVAAGPAALSAEERAHIRISPVARRMAEEHSIDITRVVGTGPGGRIGREDIEKALEAKRLEEKKGEVKNAEAPSAESYGGKRLKTSMSLKGMRKAIAEHMHRSLSVAAQLTTMSEIDMTEAAKLRKTFLEQSEAIGARITYTDILVLACARALRDNPIVNSSLIDEEIKIWEDINVGVAVALEGDIDGGLIVPVVRNADKKSLLQISQEVRTLAEKARTKKLIPDDVVGGTFTVTNLGALGVGWGFETAIINQPESAILRVSGITDRPVVREGQITIRPIMACSFTYDHRVIDGAIANRFISRVAQLLEKPELLLL